MKTYEFKKCNKLVYILGGWKPCITSELREWFNENNIMIRYYEERWGGHDAQYTSYVTFECEEDAIATLLRWG